MTIVDSNANAKDEAVEELKICPLQFNGELVPDDAEILTFIKMIAPAPLREFAVRSINAYGNEEKLQSANVVASILVEMLKKRHLISEQVHQSFIDVLLTGTLLYNLFFDEKDWTTLYYARRDLLYIATQIGIPEQVTDAIFQTIEAQMGDDTPVPTSRPQPNSPTELFAWAVWFANEYKPQV